MRKIVKVISLLVGMVMCFSIAFTGCSGSKNTNAQNNSSGKENTQKSEELKEVKLKLYLFTYNNEAEDAKKVLEEANKIFKKKINATMEYTMDMAADADKKIPLILASGEDYDGMMFRGSLSYPGEVQKGGLMEIGDLLNKYMPERMKGMTDYDYTAVKVDGKIYAIPGGFQWFTPQGYAIRGDLRKKYNIPEVKDLDGLEKYLEVLQKNEPGVIPFNTSAADIPTFGSFFISANGWKLLDTASQLGYYVQDQKPTLCYVYETNEFKTYITKAKEFVDKGYWSKNAYASKTISLDAFKEGTSFVAACHVVNANDTAIILRTKQPTWEVEFVRFPVNNNDRPSRGKSIVIPKAAKNPERLLMALELMGTDAELNTLMSYGIKDVHYNVTSGGNVKSTEAGVAKYPAYQFPLIWSNMNLNLMKPVDGGILALMDIQKQVDKYSIIPKHAGFNIKNNIIGNELAAIKAINNEYRNIYNYGAFDNADALIKQYQDKLKKAGADKVKAEVQKQLDDFLAAKK